MERFTRESLLTHITPFLTQHDLGITAQVCSNWKEISYSPFLYFYVSFPLLNEKDFVDKEDHHGRKVYAECLKLKLYSTLPPPDYIDKNGKKPFEDILQIMLATKKRFELTRSVDFKNFMFSDRALDMAVRIFPRLQKIIIDGNRMTKKGLTPLENLKHLKFLAIFLELKDWHEEKKDERPTLMLSDSCEVVWGYDKLQNNFRSCNKCGAYYNENKNGPKSCLFHPKRYDGYGHSCSSFKCCGSNTPRYPGTPGCSYGYHSDVEDPTYFTVGREAWLSELLEVPYNRRTTPHHPFVARRS